MQPISCVPNRTLLVSSYGSGATAGSNLGSPGYSYDFVVQLFEPLLRQIGKFELASHPETTLNRRVEQARQRGSEPVHLCFRGLHDVVFASDAPNAVVPAWEFPDVPNHAIDGDSRHDWVRIANDSSLVIVHGEFTRQSFERSGVRSPLAVVPVPTPLSYFELAAWERETRLRIECPAILLQDGAAEGHNDVRSSNGSAGTSTLPMHPSRKQRRGLKSTARSLAAQTYKRAIRPALPHWLDTGLTLGGRAALLELFNHPLLGSKRVPGFDLSGIVYTSIFNPSDGRKNWEDLLSAFLIGLGDCPDATLLLKLIGSDRHRANALLARYHGLNLPHRCRIIIVTDYLSDEQMLELTRGTTYYVTSTRAEGNCLPLMNYLAAGRPGISPAHTAIADYFSDEVGFVPESHPEPCAWPHDPLMRCRTTWHRLVWTSLVAAFRESYDVARRDPARYQALADAARGVSCERHHPQSVFPRLQAALDLIVGEPMLKSARIAA